MKNLTLVALLASVFLTTAVNAASLSFSPVTASTTVGSSVEVDLIISDFSASEAPLGGFVLDVEYNQMVLGFSSVSYSDFLGVAGIDSDFFTIDEAGVVSVENISFLDNADLLASQPASFSLATFSFEALAAGFSNLLLSPIEFFTGDGADITGDLTLNDGVVEVKAATVPEPTAFLLMLSSFALLLGFRRSL
ncbi:MAG: hypothetical protein GQ582_08770 [Methyloprofundus sp.]|nr:hypothetical protein [Methyloprofundus sp.]